MEKALRILKGFGFSMLFVFSGIYILKTNETLFEKIIGISCIVFFGILMLWAIYKMIKNQRLRNEF